MMHPSTDRPRPYQSPTKPASASRTNDHEAFAEVFPIEKGSLPQLLAYILDTGHADQTPLGGKLSYRLSKVLKGHWVWTGSRLTTDTKRDVSEIMEVVKTLWVEQRSLFKDLRAVKADPSWSPSPYDQASFIARGLVRDVEPRIKDYLARQQQDLENAFVERVHEVRPWVVQGQPAISISISSRLVHKQDLKTYATGTQPRELVGLWVTDKTSSLKGEITEITGLVKDHRERLLSLAQRPEVQENIQDAPDDELVVNVLAGRTGYEYVVSALRLIIRTEDFRRFRINAQQALNGMLIKPAARAGLVAAISRLLEETKLLRKAYSSSRDPGLFIHAEDVGFNSSLRFGSDQVRSMNERSLLRDLTTGGVYRRAEKFNTQPIRMGSLVTTGLGVVSGFEFNLQQQLNELGFNAAFVAAERSVGTSRDELEKAVNRLTATSPDVLLAYLPEEREEDEDDSVVYQRLKSLTVNRGIASQVVYKSTLGKKFALANITLGVLSKVGNIPFVLAEPLPYADLVVGIDIAREQKQRLPGSINATAIARIYFTNGEFVRYVIHDAPLEGETIPSSTLQALFPLNEFKGKRVVIHRDGYFRGAEKPSLRNWAQRIGATFHLVEVIKTGTPRLYGVSPQGVQQPAKGTAFKISNSEAFLVSSLPPSANSTPQPLHVRTEAPLTIEQAIHSILSLTLLHYGSLRPPRLPVTIHYSDRIAYLALRGIKPKDLEGNIPFWL